MPVSDQVWRQVCGVLSGNNDADQPFCLSEMCSKAQECLGPSPQSPSCVFREVVRILYCFPREGREETMVNAYYVPTNLPMAPCYLGKV